MCGNGQKSEACDVLRQAMLAELSGQTGAGSSAPVHGQGSEADGLPGALPDARPAKQPALTGVWGFDAKRAGQIWLTEISGMRYVS